MKTAKSAQKAVQPVESKKRTPIEQIENEMFNHYRRAEELALEAVDLYARQAAHASAIAERAREDAKRTGHSYTFACELRSQIGWMQQAQERAAQSEAEFKTAEMIREHVALLKGINFSAIK